MSRPAAHEAPAGARVTTDVGPWAMVPVWVLRAGLTGAEIAVYVSLRSYADREGSAWPSVQSIADRAGASRRTAERAIARMRDLGLLETSQWHRPDGSIGGCSYRLRDVPPAALAAPEVPTSPSGGPDDPVGGVPTRMTEQEHTNRTHQELVRRDERGAAGAPPKTTHRRTAAKTGPDPAPPGAQALIAEWIDHRKATGARTAPPSRVVGHVAREIAALLREGHPYDLVRAALQAWDARRPALSPSLLATILDDVARGPAPATAPRPGSYDARLDAERRQADAIWAQPAPAPVEFPDDPAYADPIPPATPVPHPHTDLPLF